MIQKDETHYIYSFEKAWEKCSGKINFLLVMNKDNIKVDVKNIMEGGEEAAFKKRAEKYGGVS